MTQAIVNITLEAGQDLSTKQHHFVTTASDGQIDPTGDGVLADGVLMSNPSVAGQAATVAIFGVVPVKAGDVITRGALVASDASGKAVPAASTDEILGRAMAAAGADGDIIPVLLKLSGRAPKP